MVELGELVCLIFGFLDVWLPKHGCCYVGQLKLLDMISFLEKTWATNLGWKTWEMARKLDGSWMSFKANNWQRRDVFGHHSDWLTWFFCKLPVFGSWVSSIPRGSCLRWCIRSLPSCRPFRRAPMRREQPLFRSWVKTIEIGQQSEIIQANHFLWMLKNWIILFRQKTNGPFGSSCARTAFRRVLPVMMSLGKRARRTAFGFRLTKERSQLFFFFFFYIQDGEAEKSPNLNGVLKSPEGQGPEVQVAAAADGCYFFCGNWYLKGWRSNINLL